MVVQQTSLEAYIGLTNIGQRQAQVYYALKELGKANNLMIAKKLNLPINQVTPRVLELRQKGIIVQEMSYPCPYTHKLTMFWRISTGNNSGNRGVSDVNNLPTIKITSDGTERRCI